jgi:hypothetical protein
MRAFPYNSMFPGAGGDQPEPQPNAAKSTLDGCESFELVRSAKQHRFNAALSQKVPRRADPLASCLCHSFMEIRS